MKATRELSSLLGATILRYVELKESLGHKYCWERAVYWSLDSSLATTGTDLTAASFAAWSESQRYITSGVRRRRMQVVRRLCLYRRRTEPGCFVPDPLQFPARSEHVRPHLFTQKEIAVLLHACGSLRPGTVSPLRREVVRLAIVLLYTTGLRRGELLRLTHGDYSARDRTLFVRHSKFHKSRLLPLSPDCRRELEAYLASRRKRGLPSGAETPLIGNSMHGGRAYTGTGLASTIGSLCASLRIRTPFGRTPRIHDFRHTFAVHALIRWYKAGADVQSRLPYLATYMGHVSILSTQYYLPFVGTLARCASRRFADHCGCLVSASPDASPGAQ